MRDPFRQIEVLRAHRGLPAPPARAAAGLPLAAAFGAQARALRALARSLGAAGSAFARLVPESIRERCTPLGVRAGVLSVRCDDASTGFELDRWLRSGGEIELIKAAPTMLTRVKRVGIGAPEPRTPQSGPTTAKNQGPRPASATRTRKAKGAGA